MEVRRHISPALHESVLVSSQSDPPAEAETSTNPTGSDLRHMKWVNGSIVNRETGAPGSIYLDMMHQLKCEFFS